MYDPNPGHFYYFFSSSPISRFPRQNMTISSLSKVLGLQLLNTNFSRLETLSLGPKRFLHSKGPKNAICLWLRLGNIIQRLIYNVYFRSIFLVSAKDKLHFRTFRVMESFRSQRQKFLVRKSWYSEVVSGISNKTKGTLVHERG